MGLGERKGPHVRADGIEPCECNGLGVRGAGDTCYSIVSVSLQRRPWLGAPLQVGLVGFW